MAKFEIVHGPSSYVLEVLREGKFTEPISLRKPSGQEVTTRLVREGVGMIGFTDRGENREWAGIFNHYIMTAGASLKFGRLLELNGQIVDLRLMIDTVTASHLGRRLYDEATWYPQEVSNAEEKQKMGDTHIGLAILKQKGCPLELLETISVHGLGTIFPFGETKTWNQILPLYLDYRISQNTTSLAQRFIDLEAGVAIGRFSREWLDMAYQWAIDKEKMLFTALTIPYYEAARSSMRNLKARLDVAIQLDRFSEDETKALKETDVYKPKSGRKVDIAEVVGLSQEEFLARLQLYPEDINDRLLQPERWERYIRRLYINDAEQGIFDRLSYLHKDISEGKAGSQEELEKEFPQNTWWGKYARGLYDKRHGVPLHPNVHKQTGIARAIEFYRKLEQARLDTKE